MEPGQDRYATLREATPETPEPHQNAAIEINAEPTAVEEISAKQAERAAEQPTRPTDTHPRSGSWPESADMVSQNMAANRMVKSHFEQRIDAQADAEHDAPSQPDDNRKPSFDDLKREHGDAINPSPKEAEPKGPEQEGEKEMTDAQQARLDRLLGGMTRQPEHEMSMDFGRDRNDE